jgi:hypothetical protein
MDGKEEILAGLKDIFSRWQALLAGLSDDQVHQVLTPSTWTVKDVVAHLWSWQQVSVSRMKAALAGTEPDYPQWWLLCGPDPDEDVDRTNAWLYEASRDKPWSQVFSEWKSQFGRYIQLAHQLPEEDLLALGRYPWMGNYALSASAMGSLDHHEEHFDSLHAWLQEHGWEEIEG